MRNVVIVHDSTNQRPWIAVDRHSGTQLLRLQDRDTLEKMCERLGWAVVADRSQGRATTEIDLKRAVR
jgi:hypothetical protein